MNIISYDSYAGIHGWVRIGPEFSKNFRFRYRSDFSNFSGPAGPVENFHFFILVRPGIFKKIFGRDPVRNFHKNIGPVPIRNFSNFVILARFGPRSYRPQNSYFSLDINSTIFDSKISSTLISRKFYSF